MSKIKINFLQIRACEDELTDILDIIKRDIESLNILKNNKYIKSYGFDLLYSKLEKQILDLKDTSLNLNILNKTLSDIRQQYQLYENSISQGLSISDNIAGNSLDVENNISNSSTVQNHSNGRNIALGHMEGKFAIEGAEAELFSASKEMFASGKIENQKSNIKKDRSVEFKIVEGEASLLHEENDWKNDYGEVSASIDAFKVTGEAGVKAQWMKDGKIAPFLGAVVGAGAVVVAGEVKGMLGRDNLNINGAAKREVFGGEAKASFGIGKLSENYKGAESKVGIKGEINAEAYLARGEVKGGFEIFGVKIDATVGGKAGALGIGGGFEVVNNKIETKASASALFGVDLKIGVDFSGLIKNIGKFFGK